MTLIAAAASTVAGAPSRLDPLQLFLDADIVVQVVMTGLILASIWVWTIIVSFSMRMGKLRRRTAAFEQDFWDAEQPEALIQGKRRQDNPSARVAAAGLAELRISTKEGLRNRDGTKSRVALALESVRCGGEGAPLITLRADRALDYGRVMAVMGELNRAGCNRISLVTSGSVEAP